MILRVRSVLVFQFEADRAYQTCFFFYFIFSLSTNYSLFVCISRFLYVSLFIFNVTHNFELSIFKELILVWSFRWFKVFFFIAICWYEDPVVYLEFFCEFTFNVFACFCIGFRAVTRMRRGRIKINLVDLLEKGYIISARQNFSHVWLKF